MDNNKINVAALINVFYSMIPIRKYMNKIHIPSAVYLIWGK